MGGEKLWKILCKPVGIFFEFSFCLVLLMLNAYETVEGFETSCEKPVTSQPSLHVENKT